MGDMNSPMIAKARFEEARSLYESERFCESLQILKDALNNVKHQSAHSGVSVSDALILFGWNFVALQDFVELQELERTISSLGIEERSEFELIRIWVFAKKGDFREAIKRSDAFLECNKATVHLLHPDFLMIRGYCHSRMGNPDLPIKDCENAFAVFSIQERELESGQAANILGRHLLYLGQYQDAVKWLSRAKEIFQSLDLPRKISVAFLNLGLVHYKLGDFKKSQTLLNQSL